MGLDDPDGTAASAGGVEDEPRGGSISCTRCGRTLAVGSRRSLAGILAASRCRACATSS